MATNNIELNPGLRVGSLQVIRSVEWEGKRRTTTTKWECICDCGNKSLFSPSTLSQGLIRHCEECRPKRAKRQRTIKKRERHGLGEGYTYSSYSRMVSRCCNPRHESYPNYGARGITICDRWLTSYLNFLEDMGERPKGMFLDRIDNEKGYSPENCKWSSRIEQNRNRRNTIFVDFKGERRKLIELVEEENAYYASIGSTRRLDYHLIYTRLRAGWKIEEALNTPTPRRRDTQPNFIQLHLPLFVS